MNILRIIKHIIADRFDKDLPENRIRDYKKKFFKYAFVDGECKSEEQYEASITRLYHTLEKGMAYEDYKAGFGKSNIAALIDSMRRYSAQFGSDSFFYRTALCCLKKYVKKNAEYGLTDINLAELIDTLPGKANTSGGVIEFTPLSDSELKEVPYETFVKSRHSIRHFSKAPVDLEKLKRAVALAQHTPSACNRQGWKTRIIANKQIVEDVLANQNGNRGFGDELDKLLVITGDIRYFQKNREVFQVFIDGGMYAQNVLNALHYEGIGTIPLSASLINSQEENVRRIMGIDEAEELILFIGVGNYPKKCQTTHSERRPVVIEVI